MPPAPSKSEPKQLSDRDVIPAVWGVIERPHSAGPHPSVILLPGSSGWHATYSEIAKSVAESGFVALAIDYLAETGREPSREQRLKHWGLWQAMIRNGIAYLQADARVLGQHIGLVGYSLGASLAVSIASRLPEVKAVVDFFGSGGPRAQSLNDEISHFPPLLILHGEVDSVVPVSLAYHLRDAVIAHGSQVEMHIYPGAEHAFNAPWSPNYSEPEAVDSFTRMIDFLTRRLAQ